MYKLITPDLCERRRMRKGYSKTSVNSSVCICSGHHCHDELFHLSKAVQVNRTHCSLDSRPDTASVNMILVSICVRSEDAYCLRLRLCSHDPVTVYRKYQRKQLATRQWFKLKPLRGFE